MPCSGLGRFIKRNTEERIIDSKMYLCYSGGHYSDASNADPCQKSLRGKDQYQKRAVLHFLD